MNKKILVVCMGNICRSPTAEAVLRAKASSRFLVDSAGTHAYHVGEPPDKRAIYAAQKRGYDLSSLRARQVSVADFEQFDLILAMDRKNLATLRQQCPDEHTAKLALFLQYAEGISLDEVPDPYYGGTQGFEQVLDLCENAVQGLLNRAILP